MPPSHGSMPPNRGSMPPSHGPMPPNRGSMPPNRGSMPPSPGPTGRRRRDEPPKHELPNSNRSSARTAPRRILGNRTAPSPRRRLPHADSSPPEPQPQVVPLGQNARRTAQWIDNLRRSEVVERVRNDPRSLNGTFLGVTRNLVVDGVIGGGQAEFDEPWNDLSGDDRALLYATSTSSGTWKSLPKRFACCSLTPRVG